MRSNPFQSLVNLLSNILEAHTTAFFIVDSKKRQFHLAAAHSLSKYLSESLSLPMEQSGILAQAHKAGQTIHLDKMHEITMALSSTLPFYREGESHIKGLLIEPVGKGEAVLYIDTKYSWGFNSKQQKWIREIAELLHALLKQQEATRRQKSFDRIWNLWQRLDHIKFKEGPFQDYCKSVVEECAHFLGTEYGLLAMKEPSGHRYRLLAATPNVPQNYFHQSFNAKQGLIGWIFRNQKPLLIPKLNSDSPEHFLLNTRESLPHHGTLWGLPALSSMGHSVVLAFLARGAVEWSTEDRYAVSHMLYYMHLLLEQTYFKEECEHLHTYDLSSGLLNNLAFEAKVEEMLVASMQNSVPFTLALLQVEPWQILHTKVSPKQLRNWQQQLAEGLYRAVPSGVFVGQIAENRYGILFSGLSAQEVNQHLSTLLDVSQQVTPKKMKKARIQPYLSTASFPQDVTGSEQLWTLAYQRLFEAFG
jgi:GGDEF domain-containing protein